jgi:hypothetical protein
MLSWPPSARKYCVACAEPLFLAKSGRTVILELLVESVTVADSGDMIAFRVSVGVEYWQAASKASIRRFIVHVPYHQP